MYKEPNTFWGITQKKSWNQRLTILPKKLHELDLRFYFKIKIDQLVYISVVYVYDFWQTHHVNVRVKPLIHIHISVNA